MLLSFLIAHMASSLIQAGNRFFNAILKENRLTTERKGMFKHVLDQEMSYFDEKTTTDIRNCSNL